MSRLKLYLIRVAILGFIALFATSPFLAVGFLVQGIADHDLQILHYVALTYLLLIGLGVLLISPVYNRDPS